MILTKIIATVGPGCATPQAVARMIEEGVRVFRINFSHGTFEDYAAHLARIRAAGEHCGAPVAVLGDLSGPKIRVGKVVEGGIDLRVGQRVEFRRVAPQPSVAPASLDDAAVLGTTYPALMDDVEVGQRLLVNDGAIRMLVLERIGAGDERRLVCTVTQPGLVTSGKGINLPDSAVSAPSLTAYDETCVQWAIEHELDFLALSFVRKAEDIRQLKKLMRDSGRDDRGVRSHTKLPVIAKIEKPQALNELAAILEAADGVMVARGDLGVEMDMAEVPTIQKRIIAAAHDHGKPVIVATQMLESMIVNPSPTRAEVSDVANAIYDGADAVMLSGETAVGGHAVMSVHMMKRIAEACEGHLRTQATHWDRPPSKLLGSRYRTAALAHGVSAVVRDLKAKYVLLWSELGGGARYLSQNRLSIPIVACSSHRWALRQMSMLFGVHPMLMERPTDANAWIAQVDAVILDRGWASVGDGVVVVKGEPLGAAGVTNELRIHYVGDVCRLDWQK